MKANFRQKQQGDVLFERIETLPENAEIKSTLIIREGEETGHHHAIAEPENAVLYKIDGKMIEHLFLEVKEEFATISHPEHNDIVLEKGIYKIGAVREVDWFTESVRRVID